jgi:hypothetical protein
MKLKYLLFACASLFPAVHPASAQNWILTSAPSNNDWFSIASSADGTKLAAVAWDFVAGGIYTSTNSGDTWTLTSAPRRELEFHRLVGRRNHLGGGVFA